jgi:hypothetical protein
VLLGGFRCLQGLDLSHLLSSQRETLACLRQATHLCHPLPCLLLLQGWGKREPLALVATAVFSALLEGWPAWRGS